MQDEYEEMPVGVQVEVMREHRKMQFWMSLISCAQFLVALCGGYWAQSFLIIAQVVPCTFDIVSYFFTELAMRYGSKDSSYERVLGRAVSIGFLFAVAATWLVSAWIAHNTFASNQIGQDVIGERMLIIACINFLFSVKSCGPGVEMIGDCCSGIFVMIVSVVVHTYDWDEIDYAVTFACLLYNLQMTIGIFTSCMAKLMGDTSGQFSRE